MNRDRTIVLISLILFDLVYLGVNFKAIWEAYEDESTSIGLLFALPIYWVIGGIILALILALTRWRPQSSKESIVLFFGTPAPVIAGFIAMLAFSYHQADVRAANMPSQREWCVEVLGNHYQSKETGRDYKGRLKRIAYYVSEETPRPGINVDSLNFWSLSWRKTGIWVYYNPDGTVLKQESHNGTEPLDY